MTQIEMSLEEFFGLMHEELLKKLITQYEVAARTNFEGAKRALNYLSELDNLILHLLSTRGGILAKDAVGRETVEAVSKGAPLFYQKVIIKKGMFQEGFELVPMDYNEAVRVLTQPPKTVYIPPQPDYRKK